MKFYKFNLKIEEKEGDESEQKDLRALQRHCRRICDFAFKNSGGQTYIFISSLNTDSVEGAAITRETSISGEAIEKIITDCKIALLPDTLTLAECDSHDFAMCMLDARSDSFISGTDDIIDSFEPLDEVFDIRREGIWRNTASYVEKLAVPDTREALEGRATNIMWGESIKEEFDRLYTKAEIEGVCGIPVHYILEGNNYDTREEAAEILIAALYENGRIEQKRYCEIFISRLDNSEAIFMESLFETYKGGAVVFRFNASVRQENGMEDASAATISRVCRAIKKYQKSVQVIFCFPLECEKEKERFFHYLGGISFVSLSEGSVDLAGAVNYLEGKAKKDNYTSTAGLEEKLTAERAYRTLELDAIYDEWSSGYLKNIVYPKYANVLTLEKQELEESPLGNAYEKLKNMIGLHSAKQVINDAINYYKTQKLLASRGKSNSRASMHMVFTGNPGTAKTTVARLFAEIMRDNKILKSGHLVECGRGDLVGKYVGWTAQQVQKKFEEARGGVLLIDEAYSLVDDRNGSYGDEAINTIVQEMENNRNSVVVIFAGYPDKMEGFLDKNPGLRSRIAFHVNFEDYTPDELCEITTLMANEKELTLGEGVMDKLHGIYKQTVESPDFGNGRFVRNLIEKANMKQATRLMSAGIDNITDKELATLTAEDFVYETPQNKNTRKIGFVL